MAAIKLEKTIKLNKFEIVKYQLIHHCFMNKIKLNETELECLALLGELGKIRLSEFRKRAYEKGILGSYSAVNNCLAKIEISNLFIKEGAGKKLIFLNPALGIVSEGSILIELKLIKLDETNKTSGRVQNHSRETAVV